MLSLSATAITSLKGLLPTYSGPNAGSYNESTVIMACDVFAMDSLR